MARSTPLTASFDWIYQWRESLRDGVYAVPGFLIIPGGKSDARFVGNRPSTEVRWQANRRLWFQADYGIFTRDISKRRVSPPATSTIGHCGLVISSRGRIVQRYRVLI